MLLKALLAHRAQLCSPENKRWRSPEHQHGQGRRWRMQLSVQEHQALQKWNHFSQMSPFFFLITYFFFQLTTVTLSLISSCFCNRSSVINGNCTHNCSRTELLPWHSPAVDMPVPTDMQVTQRWIFQNCLLRYYGWKFYSPDSHSSYYCLTIIQLLSNSLT